VVRLAKMRKQALKEVPGSRQIRFVAYL